MRACLLSWMLVVGSVACGGPPAPEAVPAAAGAPEAVPGASDAVTEPPAEIAGLPEGIAELPEGIAEVPPPVRVDPPPAPVRRSPPPVERPPVEPSPVQPPPPRPPPVRAPSPAVRPDVYACETAADCMIYCPDISGCCGEPCGCQTAIRKDGRAAFDTWTAATCARQPHCPAVGCAYEPAMAATCRDGRCVPMRGLGL